MGIRENIELDIAGKTIKPTDKPLSDEFADRVRWSALSSLAGMAIAASPLLFKKKFKDVKIPIAAFGLGGVPLGWNLPRVHNKYLDYIKGETTKTDAQEAYNKLVEEETDIRKRTPVLFKKASLLSGAGFVGKKLLSGASAAAGGTRKFVWQGLKGTPKSVTSLSGSRRTLLGGAHTWGVRGGVGVLGAAGLVKGVGTYRSRRRLSGNNYTTFLRNNILAGNIQPQQLSQQDLMSVRQIGMR